jgi:hypothetical protein
MFYTTSVDTPYKNTNCCEGEALYVKWGFLYKESYSFLVKLMTGALSFVSSFTAWTCFSYVSSTVSLAETFLSMWIFILAS